MRLEDILNKVIDVEDAHEEHLPEIYGMVVEYLQEELPLVYYSFREEELPDEIYIEPEEIFIDEAPTFPCIISFNAECSKKIEYLFETHYPEKVI